MVFNVTFGQWLKKRRKMLDMTQQELAQRVGCAVITIQKIEANQRRPSKQIAELLAMHLDIPSDDRPSFTKLARMGTGELKLAISTQAAYRLLWSLSPRHPTNLPVQPTPLIGRHHDVAALSKRLVEGSSRLLTLVGPPGVGKTRLAVQVAANLLDDFGDGVYFVSFAPISDPSLVPAVIGQTLGIIQTTNSPYPNRIKEYLFDKHMLLLLDNFEQVEPAALFVNDLLADCPWLSILVTSRVPLQIRRENQFPVLPLNFPTEQEAELLGLAQLASYPALSLFSDRAQAVKPDFEITSDNARLISRLCARLDGLPLAIELVAAQIKVFPPEALLESFGGRLLLYSSSFHDLPERHQTLYTAIDWSFTLLKPEEQVLLIRLGVFTGGWTLQAAESVAGDPVRSILETLTALVNNNLVVQLKQSGGLRFTLLETIRAFALEKLAECSDGGDIRQRHAEYYLALAEEAEPHLRSDQQQVWLDRLDQEGSNLREALTWFDHSAENSENLLRLVGAMGWFWIVCGHVDEGRIWSARALKKASAHFPALRAKVISRAGSLEWPGDLPAAQTLFTQSIDLWRKSDPLVERELAMALTGYALVMAYRTDSQAVQAATEEARILFQKIGDRWGTALALVVEGEAYLLRQDYVEACAHFKESLDLFRQVGDKWGASISLSNWGYTDSLLGNLASARTRIEEGISLQRQIGEKASRAIYLNVLGQIVQQQGEHEYAAVLYDESMDLMRKMGLESSMAEVLYNVANLTQSQGHSQLAGQLYQESLALFSRQGNEQGIEKCRAGLAEVDKK